MTSTDGERIALVDLSYIWKVHWHSQGHDARPGAAAQSCVAALKGIREQYDIAVLCCDSPPYEHRLAIDPDYKGQREKPAEEELAQKRWLMDRVDKLGFQIARSKGFEADDVIATLAHAWGETDLVDMIASDKDVAACVTDTVSQVVPGVGGRETEVRGPAEIRQRWGVEPEQMTTLLALAGDGSDNIKGCPGIGKVKASKLIGLHGDLTGIARAMADEHESITPALGKALADSWDQVQRAYRLVQLRTDVPLALDALRKRKEPQPLEREDAMSGEPEEIEGEPVEPESAPAEPPKPTAAIVRHPEYGDVDQDLQPMDLTSARSISKWAYNGNLYPAFKSPEAIFTILSRGRELGLGWTTALAGFHLIEGKPSASADLIRALVERDPGFEYLMLIESDAEKATWEGKHRRHPKPTRYTYTLEEAKAAGLTRPSRSGKPSNWTVRPRDMCAKTAGSKLARILWPGSVMGLYCPEEMEGTI